MANIKILDCTLRDGGYINDWYFGYEGIKNIIQSLTNANIDYVECGFCKLDNYNHQKSIFSTQEQLLEFLPLNKTNDTKYTLMINYGECDINKFSSFEKSKIIFRVVFDKTNRFEALEYCNELKNKGYDIFINPKSTNLYSFDELSDLIRRINEILPEAMTIVDTTGSMTNTDVKEIFDLTDRTLNENIKLCFHFHNNMQLSFSNALYLINLVKNRDVIIDATILGIGRGAGNLSTETITKYINEHFKGNYNINLLADIAKKRIKPIFEKSPWGYSLPYYISAINHCHPNYAKYMIEKQSLSAEIMNKVFQQIPYNKKTIYDFDLIDKICKDIIP